jgi:hypothetical protein
MDLSFFFPVKGTFIEFVEEADDEDEEEEEDGEEDRDIMGKEVSIDEGPGGEEDDFDIEEDEEHGGDVEFNGEARVNGAFCWEAAFVGHIFDRIGRSALAEDFGGDEDGNAYTEGQEDLL